MNSLADLGATPTAAERFFYAEVMSAAATVGRHMISARRPADGATEVLARHSGAWVTLDTGTLRAALAALGRVRPGLTIVCDHGYQVDNLINALAHNREAAYDDCLIDGLLQVAILGMVTFDSPADGEQDNGQRRTDRAMPDRGSDLDSDPVQAA